MKYLSRLCLAVLLSFAAVAHAQQQAPAGRILCLATVPGGGNFHNSETGRGLASR